MKRKILSLGVAIAAGLMGVYDVSAEPGVLHSAKVTEVQNDVRLQEDAGPAPASSDQDPAPYRSPAKSPTRPATVGDLVKGGRLLSTGKSSRAELLFNDNTITRLGANSIFTFRTDSRNVHLSSGFILLHTPKGNGGATVTTPTATAAVLGTTIMLSVLPDGGVKMLVLEGTGTLAYQGQTETINAGQVSIYTPGQGISAPTTIDLKKLTETSSMLKSFNGPLGSEQEIQEAIEAQQRLLASGQLSISGDENGLKFVPDSGAASAIQSQTRQPQSTPPPTPTGGGGQTGGPGR